MNLDSLTIATTDPAKIVTEVNAIVPILPKEIRTQFNTIKLCILAEHGIPGLYERMNDKSVAAILREYSFVAGVQPIESGQVGEIRYELYDRPDRPVQNETS